MAPTSRRVWLSVAITFAVVLSVAADAHLAPDDLLPFTATSGVLLSESIKSGARALLQNARVRNAENPVATAVKQAMTPATLDAAVAADAAQLKLMKHGDKTATKRASLRYYWTFACIEDVKLSAAEVAADEMAATRDNEQFVAAGVVDTRNRLIKASLALVKARPPPTKAQCIKYRATEVSAGYQATLLLDGAVGTDGFNSARLWTIVMQILPDDLDKLMPITAA